MSFNNVFFCRITLNKKIDKYIIEEITTIKDDLFTLKLKKLLDEMKFKKNDHELQRISTLIGSL